MAQRHQNGDDERAPAKAQKERCTDALLGAVIALRADVLSHESGHRRGNGLHGEPCHIVKLVAHVVGRRVGFAEGVDLRHHDEASKTHSCHLDAGGEADAHDILEKRLIKAQREGTDGDFGILAVDVENAEDPRKALGKHGRDGNACNA